MKRVLFVATVVKTHIMEFHIPYLRMFKEMGWETAVAARNDYSNPNDCIIPFCDIYYNVPFERSPFDLKNCEAFKNLRKIINEGNYDIIHCHTPVGALLTRLAARKARLSGTRVLYTAHGFHFYKGAPILNWLFYYPVEKTLARFTDILITINKEDYKRAQKFKVKKVCYVPGVGVDINKFSFCKEKYSETRKKIGLSDEDFVILSVGELNARKNHAIVLRALAMLKDSPEFKKIQYIICGQGNLQIKLQNLAKELEISEHVHFLGYRNDISAICNCSDLFIFMSIQEGLPVALMEAMGCGLPIICSNIRGNNDLIEDGISGYLVENNEKAISDALLDLMASDGKRALLGSNALKRIKQFDLSSVQTKMQDIYMNIGENTGWGGVKFNYINFIVYRQNLRKELNIPFNAFVLLSVGEVNKNKNHQVIIDALTKINSKDLYYIVCGCGPLVKKYKRLCKKLKIHERVIFTGYRNDVERFYRAADVFLFPSKREGLPVALMEAMASGLPCIASNIRGNSDLLVDNRGGYLCPSLDIKMFSEKIIYLFQNQNLCNVMGNYNQQIIEKFNLPVVQDIMKNIYLHSADIN